MAPGIGRGRFRQHIHLIGKPFQIMRDTFKVFISIYDEVVVF